LKSQFGILAGTPEEICQKIGLYENADVSYFIPHFVNSPNVSGMKAFAEELNPQFS